MSILSDDLVVNADKTTGLNSSREILVLWAIIKGSFLNKVIIVPLILILNTYLPILIKILLVVGGVYQAYEGVGKIAEYFSAKSINNISS